MLDVVALIDALSSITFSVELFLFCAEFDDVRCNVAIGSYLMQTNCEARL